MRTNEGESEVQLLVPGAGIAEIEQTLIESVTSCHDAQALIEPLQLTVLTSKSEYRILRRNHLTLLYTKCRYTSWLFASLFVA